VSSLSFSKRKTGTLTSKDGPERPRYGDGASKITFRGTEGIGDSRALQEEERKEGKDFSPDARGFHKGIDAKRLKSGYNDEDGRPAMIQTERKMNEYWIGNEAKTSN